MNSVQAKLISYLLEKVVRDNQRAVLDFELKLDRPGVSAPAKEHYQGKIDEHGARAREVREALQAFNAEHPQ